MRRAAVRVLPTGHSSGSRPNPDGSCRGTPCWSRATRLRIGLQVRCVARGSQQESHHATRPASRGDPEILVRGPEG